MTHQPPHAPKQTKHTSQIQLELEALLKFYTKAGGAGGSDGVATRTTWKVSTGWQLLAGAVTQTADVLLLRGPLDKQLPLFGVQWERNHVVTIDLSGNNLKGTLAKEITALKSLKLLKLRDNPQLKGAVPMQLYHMPHLQYCYVDGTALSNVLPHDDAQSFQITKLHASSASTVSSHKKPVAAATVVFSTTRSPPDAGYTRWIADMSESELFMVSTTLRARHEKPRNGHDNDDQDGLPHGRGSNATGPERVEAAIKLQRIYRARMARTKFRTFLKSLFEKQFDATTGYEYFVDKRTGETMWERPQFVAKTPRKDDSESNQEVWQPYDDGSGNAYYWNRITGESTWEPPVFLSRIYTELRERYGTDKTDDERFALFFQDIDKDNTGSIDRDEFARLCGDLGMAMTTKQITNVFDELDTSGDGELSRDEITSWLTRNF